VQATLAEICLRVITGPASASLPPLKIPAPRKTTAWALPESDFGPGLVGGKSGHLAVRFD